MGITDSNQAVAAVAGLVPESETVPTTTLPLWLREANVALGSFANLCTAEDGKRTAQINSRLLEDLRRDLMPPCESGHPLRDRPVAGDGEHPPGCFTTLPCVEAVDEIEARPRYVHRGITLTFGTCVNEQPETLVIGKPRCACMPCQHLPLRWCGIQSEPECRMAHDYWMLCACCDSP